MNTVEFTGDDDGTADSTATIWFVISGRGTFATTISEIVATVSAPGATAETVEQWIDRKLAEAVPPSDWRVRPGRGQVGVSGWKRL